MGKKVMSHDFNLHFSNDECLASFHMHIEHLYICLGEISAKYFGHSLMSSLTT